MSANFSAPSGPNPHRPRLGADDRRAQILASARQLFAERGFHNTRTRDLAEQAGVSEALLFRHFPTKLALVQAIVESLGISERLGVFEAMAENSPPRDCLLFLAEQSLTLARTQPDVFRLLHFGVLEIPDMAREFYRYYIERMLGVEARIFERAMAQGALHPALQRSNPEARVLARSFHGSLMFYNLTGAVLRVEPLPEHAASLAVSIANLYIPEVNP